ncbi:MAG TPA: hypothetical protein VJ917_02965 [Saprospiraceae bacterium]|nr:hypothetical protein [Saprospiraceae bacterium]
MSRKSFEDKLRGSLKDYNSPLSKEEMYQDFLNRTEKEENKRRVLWLMVPGLITILSMLGVWFYQHVEKNPPRQPGAPEMNRTGQKQAQSSNSSYEIIDAAEVKNQKVEKEEPPSDNEEYDAAGNSGSEVVSYASPSKINERFPRDHSDQELEKDLHEIQEIGQKVDIQLPLRAVSTEIPVLEFRKVFLLLKQPSTQMTNFKTRKDYIRKEEEAWGKVTHLEFSYGYFSPVNQLSNTLSSQIDRLGVTAGKEWISPKNWTFGLTGGFARYNLMQDGKMLLQPSYDTLAMQAMLTMVHASLNGDFPGTPDSYDTGYSLLQYQNAIQLGIRLGKLIPLRGKLEAEFNTAFSTEYVWRSEGEWSNPERGVYLDYKFEDYSALAVSLRGQAGLRMHLTHENFLRLGVSYHTDLSDRRRDSDLFRRFQGIGFYLGLSKFFH